MELTALALSFPALEFFAAASMECNNGHYNCSKDGISADGQSERGDTKTTCSIYTHMYIYLSKRDSMANVSCKYVKM